MPPSSMRDPRCPPGYRLWIQCFDAKTEGEARERLRRMDAEKAAVAVIMRGTRKPRDLQYGASDTWEWQESGFRAYLPIRGTCGS